LNTIIASESERSGVMSPSGGFSYSLVEDFQHPISR